MGELGKPAGVSKEAIREQRLTEFKQATASFNAEVTVLSFPDLQLSFQPFENLAWAFLKVVRELKPGLIVTFHPNEMTQYFHHPDHTIVGKVVEWADTAADVADLEPESDSESAEKKEPFPKPMDWRPDMLFWTTNDQQANTRVSLTADDKKKRRNYIERHYQSQHIPEEVLQEIMPNAELFVRLKRTPGTIKEPADAVAQTKKGLHEVI